MDLDLPDEQILGPTKRVSGCRMLNVAVGQSKVKIDGFAVREGAVLGWFAPLVPEIDMKSVTKRRTNSVAGTKLNVSEHEAERPSSRGDRAMRRCRFRANGQRIRRHNQNENCRCPTARFARRNGLPLLTLVSVVGYIQNGNGRSLDSTRVGQGANCFTQKFGCLWPNLEMSVVQRRKS